jgi:hypothetical protein
MPWAGPARRATGAGADVLRRRRARPEETGQRNPAILQAISRSAARLSDPAASPVHSSEGATDGPRAEPPKETAMTTPTTAAPEFRLSRPSSLRVLAIVAVCVAVIAGFLLQVWRAPAPETFRPVTTPAALHLRA